MESEIIVATIEIWKALNNLEKVVGSIATDGITLKETRAIRAALNQAAIVDVKLKRDLY